MADLDRDYPPWHAWTGVLYARRLYASRGGMLITSWTAAEPRMRVRDELRDE